VSYQNTFSNRNIQPYVRCRRQKRSRLEATLFSSRDEILTPRGVPACRERKPVRAVTGPMRLSREAGKALAGRRGIVDENQLGYARPEGHVRDAARVPTESEDD
jgi:hypothetical protein